MRSDTFAVFALPAHPALRVFCRRASLVPRNGAPARAARAAEEAGGSGSADVHSGEGGEGGPSACFVAPILL